MEWLAALIGLIGTALTGYLSYSSGKKTQELQMQHDINMANLQAGKETAVQKSMFDYQNSFNSWANNKSQMVEAGLNPALMFGSTSPVTFGASGSASGSASSLPVPDIKQPFRSLDPFEMGNYRVAKQNADTSERVGNSVIEKNTADALRSGIETASKTYDLDLRKRMEKTIIDTATANLENINAETSDFKSRMYERDALLPGRILNLDAEYRQKVLEIEREPLVRKRLSADISHLRALSNLAQEQSFTEGYRRSEIVDNMKFTRERLKSSELERVAKMFGLHQRHKGNDHIVSEVNGHLYVRSAFSMQEKQAFKAFQELGYSQDEATMIVLYYSGVEPKDLTPSIINGASRILGGIVGDKSSITIK